ncbi:CTP synthase [Candidatus Woesearchaeota archaeon]|nr:CTP synthase [Candidatus Woesearchaeota archaeon]
MRGKAKWIVVTGGVISTLGKGIIASSIGMLLRSRGFKVACVKIDPYINIDAGTMRPTEHGEVFVTFDGGETDQDLGNYERFMDLKLSKSCSITTGQVYLEVISKERNLEYDGKCVEVIPHIPLEVERRLRVCAESSGADFVIVEIGGTIGDYQNVLFLEALRSMKLRGESIAFVHVAYLPIPNTAGEMKSKPAQHSIRALNANGLQADFVVCRASRPIDDLRREKISLFGNVPKENVISCEDVETIYEVPLLFDKQGLDLKILKVLNEPVKNFNDDFVKWSGFVDTIKNPKGSVRIGIVGKYFDTGDFALEDSYISVVEAVKHACYHQGVKPDIQWISSIAFESNGSLDGFDGLIVPGGFGSSGINGKINAIKLARENKIPFLGLCYGMQLAVIEHARNVLGWSDANSAEINPNTKFPVIDVLPEQKRNIKEKNYGASMRLGDYPAELKKGSVVKSLYGKDLVVERHRHRYEVNPLFKDKLEVKGLVFSGFSPNKKLVEFLERNDHPFFVGTQAHPEFTSNFLRPNPLFSGFIKAAIKFMSEK